MNRGMYTPVGRVISALEVLLGGAIVIGHNVYHVFPNEVPVLAVLGLLSMRLRDGGESAMGFRRPASWRRVVAIGLAAAALRIVVGQFLVDPITAHFWPPAVAPAEATEIRGNITNALLALLLVWTFAAFGEEIAYRGYLLNRAADVGERSPASYLLAVVLVSVLFGYGHYYKGPAGVVDSGIAGLILGVAYVVSGNNLWTCILAHGVIDTVGVIALYFGWDT